MSSTTTFPRSQHFRFWRAYKVPGVAWEMLGLCDHRSCICIDAGTTHVGATLSVHLLPVPEQAQLDAHADVLSRQRGRHLTEGVLRRLPPLLHPT